MCRLRKIAMRDYQESVTTGQTDRHTDRQTDRRTDGQTDAGQSYPYVPLCFAGDTKTDITKKNSYSMTSYNVMIWTLYGIVRQMSSKHRTWSEKTIHSLWYRGDVCRPRSLFYIVFGIRVFLHNIWFLKTYGQTKICLFPVALWFEIGSVGRLSFFKFFLRNIMLSNVK